MTLDEYVEVLRLGEDVLDNENLLQLAEWLEELKALREEKEYWNIQNHKAHNQGRTDAIDEYKLRLLEEFDLYDHKHGYPCMADINEILNDTAKQLKDSK